MVFRDRDQAARLLEQRLAEWLGRFPGQRPVVLGIPRGAVPMAKIISDALDADLDIVLVRKFASLDDPEFALGSVAEDGDVFLGHGAETLGLDEAEISEAARREVVNLQKRRNLYTPHRRPIDLGGRVVIIVDDGIATGATTVAAVRSVQAQGAAHVLVATPVASNEAVERLTHEGAEICSLLVPEVFAAVSEFYEDFDQVEDEAVIRILSGQRPEVVIHESGLDLKGYLVVPDKAKGLVIFAHGRSDERHDARNQFIARRLQDSGMATLLVDLLQESEQEASESAIDVETLSKRLSIVASWVLEDPQLSMLPHGYLGAQKGAAAALHAASVEGDRACAVVSWGGRPELVWEDLAGVVAPTSFVVAAGDREGLDANREAYDQMSCERDLRVVSSGEAFDAPGALEQVAHLTVLWFERHVTRAHPHTGLVASPVSAAGPRSD